MSRLDKTNRLRICILASHPIQYQAPWFRALAKEVELEVFFAHRPSMKEQGEGFGKAFEWDVDLLEGYSHRFLVNRSKSPGAGYYGGCDTPEIATRIAEGGFDAVIVNGWYLKSYWQAVKACRRNGIAVLVRGDSQLMTPRSKLKAWAKAAVYRQMLKRFDCFLTVGQRNREYLQHYGVAEEKLFHAPHFIDNEWFGSRATMEHENAAALRADWQEGVQGLVILFVGKFIAEKRASDLIAAVARVQPAIGCRVVMIGSGALETDLRRQAATLGLPVQFVGFKNQSDLPSHYAAADVLVLSSVSETWGLVVNEAMACGTPAIVSEACGCAPDLIEEGRTGFTFATGDVTGLARKLRLMAEMKHGHYNWKPALAQKMAVYSVETCTAGTLHAIRSVISKGRAIR
jgi:glycosyltransferase involved in cell wall biosynthesis